MLWTRTLFDEHHDSPLMKLNHIFSVRRVGVLSQPGHSSAHAAAVAKEGVVLGNCKRLRCGECFVHSIVRERVRACGQRKDLDVK